MLELATDRMGFEAGPREDIDRQRADAPVAPVTTIGPISGV
jgi:hypothetical protein